MSSFLHGRRTAVLSVLILIIATPFGGWAGDPSVAVTPATAPAGLNVPGAQWVTVGGTSGRKFTTAIFRPQGAGPFPVVVVLHGAGGLDGRYLGVAGDVARAGFLVVAGCWQAVNQVCTEATPPTAWVADPATNSGKELIAAARALPDARADRIGLYGLSRGGHAALWAAATGAGVRALVVDAPGHRPAIFPAPASTFDVVDRVAVPVLILHGNADRAIPVEQSREYERTARSLGKPVTAIYFDGIGHMPSVEPESQSVARQHAIAFLRKHL
jgi:dienelactone hydrolase